jgi:YegS/Rv2252/BmrU family lipid kinase
MTVAPDRGVLVVANAEVDADELDAAVRRLSDWSPTEVVRTRTAGDCRGCVESLDGRLLVVAGGDGTLSSMIQLLCDRELLDDVVVGLLPLGTGNDFARTVGLPLDGAGAAAVIVEGAPRPFDLVVGDGGSVVVNAVHAGIGADAAEASERFKEALGPAAYPVGAALVGASGTPRAARITVDGEIVFDGGALLVGIANGRTIGGGAPLAPDARPDDGLLDVVIVEAATMAEKVAFAHALRDGAHLERPDVTVFRGRQVEITGEAVRYDADGEISEPRERARFGIDAGALQLIAPAR